MSTTRRSITLGATAATAAWLLIAALAYYLWLPSAGYVAKVEESKGAPTGYVLDFSTSTPERLPRFGPDQKPKNLILLIGDGMGFSQLTGARMALKGPNGRLTLERFPVTGWSSTHSATEVYTDSAAGASALATGFKTDPSHLSVSPDGQPQETLFEKALSNGKALGLVTDSMIFDATPSAFGAHRPYRRDYAEIAEQLMVLKPEVLVGETRSSFDRDEAWQARFRRFEEAGYARLDALASLDQALSFDPAQGQGPWLGLYPAGSIADADTEPGLAALAVLALKQLSQNPNGFVLMVETEETDTASHRGDFDRMVEGIRALDQVAEIAVDFASAARDTLVLATADHETGGLAILGGDHGQSQRVRWATGNHSAEPVPVLAYGPGSEAFTGVLDNAEVGRLLADLLSPPPTSVESETGLSEPAR